MDSAQIERVSMFNLLLAHGGKLTTTEMLESLNVSRKTALKTMVEFKAIGLIEIEDIHESGQNNISKRMVTKFPSELVANRFRDYQILPPY